jgi:Flp pilus assembly pilin Flp
MIARLLRDGRGASAAEFALVAPLLILLLFGTLEAARWLFFAAAFREALGTAARCPGAGTGCASPAAVAGGIEQGLARLSAPLAVPPGAVRIAPAPCGRMVTARLTYPPLFLPRTLLPLSLGGSACAPLP